VWIQLEKRDPLDIACTDDSCQCRNSFRRICWMFDKNRHLVYKIYILYFDCCNKFQHRLDYLASKKYYRIKHVKKWIPEETDQRSNNEKLKKLKNDFKEKSVHLPLAIFVENTTVASWTSRGSILYAFKVAASVISCVPPCFAFSRPKITITFWHVKSM